MNKGALAQKNASEFYLSTENWHNFSLLIQNWKFWLNCSLLLASTEKYEPPNAWWKQASVRNTTSALTTSKTMFSAATTIPSGRTFSWETCSSSMLGKSAWVAVSRNAGRLALCLRDSGDKNWKRTNWSFWRPFLNPMKSLTEVGFFYYRQKCKFFASSVNFSRKQHIVLHNQHRNFKLTILSCVFFDAVEILLISSFLTEKYPFYWC